ncbi:MAG: beta-lactamase family protein [Gammaproteobacteria bacterium]|nr:beta-lactamase family protein [Gammaproteobacteria bacterium]
MKAFVFTLTLTLSLMLQVDYPAYAAGLKAAKPERVGVSSERLQRLNELADKYVAEGSYSGIVTMVARNGKIIHSNAAGTYGVNDETPMADDTLFRIYSMTKPVTAVAAMVLYEQGKFHLDDPVAKYLPELADLKVLKDGEMVDPMQPATMRHLLTHTAGMTYGWTADNPVDKQYAEAKLFASKDLDEFIGKLAEIPLRFEPGSRYFYSVSFDVLGAAIERISGTTLDKFMHQNIFAPLGMHDTFFEVPADKMHRLASDQRWDHENNKIATIAPEHSRPFDKVGMYAGGGGLVSTIGDYMRFCQMVLNGGSLDGVRILGPKTVALLSSDQLTPKVRAEGVGQYPLLDLYPGQSMAFAYGVVTDPDVMPDIASQGELSWGGVAGTKFWIDPKEKLIAIAMVQLYESPQKLRFDLKSAIYPALTELY